MEYAALQERVVDSDKRQWRRAATIASVIATTATHSREFGVDAFDPYYAPEPAPPMDWRKMLATVEALNTRAGGKDLRAAR